MIAPTKLLRRRRERKKKKNALEEALNECDEFEDRDEDLLGRPDDEDLTMQEQVSIFYFAISKVNQELIDLIDKQIKSSIHAFTVLKDLGEGIKNNSSKCFVMTDGEPSNEFIDLIENFKNIDSFFVLTPSVKSLDAVNQKQRNYLINWCENNASLIECLRRSREELFKQSNAFSIYNKKEKATRDLSKEAGSFLFFQLFKSALSELPRTPEAKTMMITTCRDYYRGNLTEMKNIDDFEKTYSSETAIPWYTKQSFVYKFINKALRTEDIDVLYQFRFYILDLSTELHKKYVLMKEKQVGPLKLYRGLKLNPDEIESFRKSVGNLISTNGYLSTSSKYQVAFDFATKPAKRKEVVKALFEYEIDLESVQSIVLADIHEYSVFPEEAEVLVDIGASFQVVSCEFDTTIDLWKIKAKATDQGAACAAEFIEYQKKKMSEANMTLMFGNLLLEMGEHTKAERYFNTILKSSKPNDEEIACIYFNFGRTNRLKGDFFRAVSCYHRAYQLHITARPKRLASAGKTLNGLGVVYCEQGRKLKAEACFRRAMQYYHIAIPKKHPDVAATLINLGIIDCLQRDFDSGKEAFTKAKKIYDSTLPPGHPNRALPRINLGNILHRSGQYQEAMEEYQTALKLLELSLPADHPDIARTLNNIAVIYKEVGEPDRAKEFLGRVNENITKTLPENHPLTNCLSRTKFNVEQQLTDIILLRF